jgi:hypothetical protein
VAIGVERIDERSCSTLFTTLEAMMGNPPRARSSVAALFVDRQQR